MVVASENPSKELDGRVAEFRALAKAPGSGYHPPAMSMTITSIGGGPAGLYTSILMKKAFPDAQIVVYERNRPDDTFGWGVVFSDETLGNFEVADAESMASIKKSFRYWTDIETYFRGTKTVSTGHGFCGLSRKRLLNILHDRCRELGVRLVFETEIEALDAYRSADLVLAVDGVNSKIRDRFATTFQPSIDWRKCKFCWLGTTLELGAFTFIFKETPWGLFQVHAYPYEAGLSTFIVECREEVWKKAGLDRATEAETIAFCEKLFADDLKGNRLLGNKSIWRTFPTIKNAVWHHENIVLMGDAAHTAHFSIGSGTKLAMEDAIALVDAFKKHGTGDVPRVLAAYQDAHMVDTIKIQKAAQTSLEWFENSARYMKQDPIEFTFNLMTRSKRITYDNLALRDPALVARTRDWYAATAGGATLKPVPPAFVPIKLRGLEIANRVAVSPMCQYSAVDGTIGDWHLVHLGSRAIGGAGLVFAEATGVAADGRISPGCTGMYKDEHVVAWKRVVDFVKQTTKARIGIQLAHAGRKASTEVPWAGDKPLTKGAWPTIAPSPIPFAPGWPAPRAMEKSDLDRVKADFVRAAERSVAAGFEMIEVHMAHGYLMSSFISPLANKRHDAYGGDIEGRMRFPLEAFDAMRAVLPKSMPMSVRVSATDWAEGGLSPEDLVAAARLLKEHGCDIIDVSTGGIVHDARPEYGRMYQVPFAELIRHEAGIPVMAVGAIQNVDHANTVIAAGRADMCCIARAHLADPYLTLHAAEKYGVEAYWPNQYLAVKPRT